jgi:glycerol-3-phosphate cytidylyltransferase-like family protein
MKVACAVGLCNPLDVHELQYLEYCKDHCDRLIVIVKNDTQAGITVLHEKERLKILRNLKCVDAAVISSDTGETFINTLRQVYPDIFFALSEHDTKSCELLGIHTVRFS